MIISPLEQFNILSLADLSLSGGLQGFLVVLLITTWSLFYIYPLTLVNFVFYNDTVALSYVAATASEFYQVLFTNGSLALAGPLSASLISFKFLNVYSLMDGIFSIYNSSLSYIWYLCYANLDILYSADHLSFVGLPHNLIFFEGKAFDTAQAKDTLTSSQLDFLTKNNINLVSENFGCFLVSWYLVPFEIFLSLKILVCNLVLASAFNLSVCDFSYLILSLNTSTIWQILGMSLVGLLFMATTWKNSITLVAKNRWQNLLEMFYLVIFNVVNENAGPAGKRFFPLIFTTFVIIVTCNVLGMIPYSFTVTSHLIVTFSTALAIFTGMNILGVLKHGKHFLSICFPPGAPIALAPLLVLIEFISYVFRVLSLSIRLFANLMSGHTLLKILATFSWGLVSLWGLFLLPVAIIFIVTGLEMAIAFLQAYIFSVLLCIYLNDAFNLH